MTATIGTATRVDDAPRTGRAWLAAAWVATAVAVLAHLYVARSAIVEGVPTFTYDEIDTLFTGRAALGITTPQITGAGYFPGSAILVAPLWWLTSDPYTFYRLAIAVGVVVALATIWPLARIATRLGLTAPQAVTVAAVVMTLPARTVQDDYALAEKVLFLVVSLAVLAAVRLTERATYARAVVFSALVGAAYFTHARMLVLVAVAAIWLVLVGVLSLGRARGRWLVALAGLASLVGFSWGAGRLARHINGLVNPHGFHQQTNALDQLRHTRPGLLARAGLGQSWEQLVSGFGLATVGFVIVAVVAWRELRRREIGLHTLLLGSTVAMLAASTTAWAVQDQLFATSWRRLDAWIYGRYVDPLFALLTLVALAAVVTGVRRGVLAGAWALALVIAVPTVFWVARDAPTWGFITPAHIPGAMAWSWALPEHRFPPGLTPSFTNANRFWVWATLTSLLPLVALVVVRRRPLVVAGLVLALAAGGTFYADRASDEYQSAHGPNLALVDEMRDVLEEHPGTTVSFAEQCPSKPVTRPGGRRNRFAWALLPTILSRDPNADIVIACADAPLAQIDGAVTLGTPVFGGLYAWVRPGPLQDALRREGLVPQPTS